MELIHKQVSLEPGKSRYPGLLSFLDNKGEKGDNYNEFIWDIDFSLIPQDHYFSELRDLGVLSYRTAISRFHWCERFFTKCFFYRPLYKDGKVTLVRVREFNPEEYYNANYINNDLGKIVFQLGYDIHAVIFLESIDDVMPEMIDSDVVIGVVGNTEETEYTYINFMSIGGMLFYEFMERAIGRIAIPEEISGTRVPNFIYLTKIEEYLHDLIFEKENPKCCRSLYEDMGGKEMEVFLNSLLENYCDKEKDFFHSLKSQDTTGFNVKILLNQNYDDMGIVELIAEEWIPGAQYYQGDTIIYNEETYCCIESIEVSIAPDEDDKHWKRLSYKGEELSHDMIEYTGESLIQDFRNQMLICYDDNQVRLFGTIQYDSEHKPKPELDFPFKRGYVSYVESEVYGDETIEFGNILLEVEKNEATSQYHFEYVVGGKLLKNEDGSYDYDSESNTGIHYSETYDYFVETFVTGIDGVVQEYTQEVIDFDSYKASVDSTGGKVIYSNMSHPQNNIFERSDYDGENMTYSGIYRNEKDFGLSEKKVWEVNVDVNRSSNAAFQKHFELLEVNTFEDIENYRNNDFALD